MNSILEAALRGNSTGMAGPHISADGTELRPDHQFVASRTVWPHFVATIHPKSDTGELFPSKPPVTAKVNGRDAWALLHLLSAGAAGLTALERPAVRWSAHVHKLRNKGIVIETIDEKHGGTFAGSHARYVLRSNVTVAGGNLDEYLANPEGRREFGTAPGFMRRAE